MKKLKDAPRALRFVLTLVSIPLALTLEACDTAELLEVALPGNVTAVDIETPDLAGTMRVSAIGDFECVWDSYVAGAAAHSDEYIQSSGNFSSRRQMLRDIPPDFPRYATDGCHANYGLFTPMHTARFMLESHFDRLQTFSDADVRDRQRFMAEMRTYSGFVYIAFGEGFCGTPLDAGDKTYTPTELLQIAVEHFTEALSIAGGAGLDHLVNAARVGRSRANLGLEQYSQVIADAELVPEGFRFDATREDGDARRENKHFDVNRLETNRVGTVAPSFRDLRWKGEPDPRVNIMNTGFIGHDNATIVWRHDKVNSYGDDVRIASYEEAQMFIAEAAALMGDLARARSILNDFHTKAGIPPILEEDIPTQDDVIRQVIEERRREFFVEGGHRLRDHLRWRGTRFEVPMLGEPGSDHPNGVDQYGQSYGSTTCYPVAAVELTS